MEFHDVLENLARTEIARICLAVWFIALIVRWNCGVTKDRKGAPRLGGRRLCVLCTPQASRLGGGYALPPWIRFRRLFVPSGLIARSVWDNFGMSVPEI